MRPYSRILRVNNLIKEELAKIIFESFSFQNSFITLLDVQTSKDLLHSNVKLTVFPQKSGKKVLDVLNKNIFFIQQKLNKKLKMRPIPKIRLIWDEESKRTMAIEKVIKKGLK